MHHPPFTQCRRTPTIGSGFTLIEMSIVLVIVGLIIGGILIGRDMIEQAKLRSQISQITQYNLAVKTFQIKYNCLPGDCRHAASVGFVTRTGANALGDGDGRIEGYAGGDSGGANLKGEQILFWRDLSDSRLISETLNTATDSNPSVNPSTTDLSPWLPRSKLGGYVYAWQGGTTKYPRDGVDGTPPSQVMTDGFNYFSIGASGAVLDSNSFYLVSMPVLTSLQAYSMDVKLDDGLPQFGKVHTHDGTRARWSSGDIITWSGSVRGHLPGAYDTDCMCPVISTSVPPISTPTSATTCYDNANVANATMQYSISTNGGSGMNCNLTFRFE